MIREYESTLTLGTQNDQMKRVARGIAMKMPTFDSVKKNYHSKIFGLKSFSKPLIQLFFNSKNDFQRADFRRKQNPLYDDFFDDLGID